MKTVYKVLLGNIGLSLAVALLYMLAQWETEVIGFLVTFGVTCLCVALCCLIISVTLFIVGSGDKNREWAQGFLLSCGVLILIGFTVCTTALQGMH